MKTFILAVMATFFLGCNNSSRNSSELEDSLTTDTSYESMTSTSESNAVKDGNDTTAYGIADSARR